MSADDHITATTTERLVYMANQIARFHAPQSHEAGVAGVAEHIRKFWDPRMKTLIAAYIAEGGAGLAPVALEALQGLVKA